MTSTKLQQVTQSLTVLAIIGCSINASTDSVPDRYNWEATDFFEDPTLIQLCEAIAAGDSSEVARIISTGATVNTVGIDNMTPLLWAYFHDQQACFKQLLKAGADPNVQVTSVLRTRGEVKPNDSLVSLAAQRTSPYFELSLSHSEVRFEQTDSMGHSIFDNILLGGGPYLSRIEKSINLGADVHVFNSSDRTPAMTAVALGKYDAALYFLDHGHNIALYENDGLRRLIHYVISPSNKPNPGPQVDFYERVLQRLIDHGESIDQAKDDLQRWKSWGRISPKQYRVHKEKEVAERKERGARQVAEKGKRP